MRHLRVASACLLALAALVAAEPAPAVEAPKPPAANREYTTQPKRTITAGKEDPKLTAKVALFVSEDGGKSWRKDQELAVPEGAAAMPAFTFVAPKDGTFGLWTVATSRDGRAEAEPIAGAAPKLELVVDRAPPTLGRLEATLGGVDAGQATLALSWLVNDPNLGGQPVSLEISTDLGKSFTARHSGPAEGTTVLTVPAEAAEVQVRVVARDLAGNVLTSPAKAVALPVAARPANAESDLAAAVAALPTPGELGIAGRSGAPIVAAATGESPVASAAPAADAPAKPGAATAPAGAPAVASGPGADAADEPAQPGQAATDEADRPARSPAPPGARATVVDPTVPFLTGGAAATALESARKEDQRGNVNSALGQYLRLHRSSVAKPALEDELNLLRRVVDHATIIAIVEQLPPELRTDPARLHAARANLALGNAEAAAAWAAKVRVSSDEAREATLIFGKALKQLGRKPEAGRVFAQLAAGDDDIAAQARAEQ